MFQYNLYIMTTNIFKQINMAMVPLFQCQYNLYHALHYIGATQRRCDTFQYKITNIQEVFLCSIQEYQTQHPKSPLALHVYL